MLGEFGPLIVLGLLSSRHGSLNSSTLVVRAKRKGI